MKKLTALFAATAITLTAGLAQAATSARTRR